MPHFEVQTVREQPLNPGIAEHSPNASGERKLVPHFEVQTVQELPLSPGIAEHSLNASMNAWFRSQPVLTIESRRMTMPTLD